MKRRKLIGILTVLVIIAATFVGCGRTKNELAEDPNTIPKDTYEINWYIMADTLKDTASVEAKVNEYLKDKMNATLKIHGIETSQYGPKMNAMISANEYFDIAFCSHWMLDYRTSATNNAWLPLDDYMEKYMPKTVSQLGKDIINNARVNGKVYAIPALKEFAESRGWMYRKDIADKYNINMNQIKSLDQLEPVLEQIKANEPNIQYPIDWSGDRTPIELAGIDRLSGEIGIFYDKYPGRVMNVVETPEFVEACKTAYRFYEKGLIKKDVLTANDFSQRLKDGKIFCYIDFLKPGKAQETARNFNFPLAQAEVTPVMELNGAGTGSMMAISNTSRNPARAMRFLELLNTDKYLNNLINYGIEGKHYKKIDENTIEIKPNTPYTLQGSQWMTGNVFLNYLTKGEDPNKMQQLSDFNRNAKRPQHYGFLFDPKPIQKELTACGVVTQEYRPQPILGGVDPEPVIEEYRLKLKEAGIDKVVKELQRQYSAFLAKKK